MKKLICILEAALLSATMSAQEIIVSAGYGSETGRTASRKNKADECDAVTSATPTGGFSFSTHVPELSERPLVIIAEFNTSFDYNESYTKQNSGINGQPSVVYRAEISAECAREIALDFVGTGAVSGSDGDIHASNGMLTTALHMVRHISVTVE